MDSLEQHNLGRKWPFWLGAVITFAFAASRFVNGTPLGRHGGIDDSYMQALHDAFLNYRQFGRDVVFTFGPWGFLYGGYHPATHWLAALIWLALAGLFCWASWRAALGLSENRFAAWCWVMAFTAVAGINLFLNIDVLLSAWVVLLWLLYFFVETRPLTHVQAALVVALGLLSLVKFNLLLLVSLTLLLIAVDTVLRYGRFPWMLAIYCVSVLFFWAAAGQQLRFLGPFLAGSWRLASGYTEAMMLSGKNELLDVAWFGLASLPLIGLAAVAAWKQSGWGGLFPLAALALLIFLTFKQGYVRHDGHEVTASLELLQISLGCMLIAWPLVRDYPRGWALATCIPVLLVFLYASSTLNRCSGTGLLSRLAQTLRPHDSAASLKSLLAPGTLRQDYQYYLADVRGRFPVPRVDGATDIYPCNQAALLAQGLVYQPRPVLQSYCAYAPELAELNADALRHYRAPRNIFFSVGALDDHFPALDDSLTWPELLSRYDIQEVQSPFTLWKQAASPRDWRLVPLGNATARLGETLPLPSPTNGPIWAKIDCRKTFPGSLLATVYKPPILRMTLTMRDGGRFQWRFVPGMARSGFLLSPVVQDNLSLLTLAAGEATRADPSRQPISIALSEDPDPCGTGWYRPGLRVEWFRLEFSRQDLTAVKGLRKLKSLSAAVETARVIHADYPFQLTYSPAEGSILMAAPNSTLLVPIPAGKKQLQLGFGVQPNDPALCDTNTVGFRVSVAEKGGKLTPLWTQLLAPASRPSERGLQIALVDLSHCPGTNLTLETFSTSPNQAGMRRCYWSEISFQ